MCTHVLLNLLNELGKEIQCKACQAFYSFLRNKFINSIIQEPHFRFYYQMTLKLF